MRRWALKLEDFGISNNAYQELLFFCRRYGEMKEALESMCTPSTWPDNMPRGSEPGNPTASIVNKKSYLICALRDIEQSALKAAGELYPYMIRNVTEGTPYAKLMVPQGEKQFYKDRRKFFIVLAKRRGII